MDSPKYVEKVTLERRASMEMSSPFKNVSVAFNWLNRDYPIYHDHSHWEILLIISGTIHHHINGYESVLKRGDVCVIRPADKHSLVIESEQEKQNFQQLNITFSDDYARKLLEVFDSYEAVLKEEKPIQFLLDESELDLVYTRALLTQNLPQQNYEMSTKLILVRLMTSFYEQKTLFDETYPAWLNEFVLCISNPKSFGKPMSELVVTTPYSYSRLSTLFKEYVGTTIVDYINEKKMVYAKRLLQTTTLTILQISEMIGYSSLSSFNHLFKKSFGITPSEYRNRKSRKEPRNASYT